MAVYGGGSVDMSIGEAGFMDLIFDGNGFVDGGLVEGVLWM